MVNRTCVWVWNRDIMTELQFTPRSPIQPDYDNKVSVNITVNSIFYEHTKHPKVSCYLVWGKKLKDKTWETHHTSSINQQINSVTTLGIENPIFL